jgi:cell wall assembly regulator SMI1
VSIAEDWQSVERWLTAHAPKVLRRLPSGATEGALKVTEVQLKVALPPDLRESLAIHDGIDEAFTLYQSEEKFKTPYGPFPLGRLLPLRRIVMAWQSLGYLHGKGAKAGKTMRQRWWHKKWVPILESLGNFTCLDLDPVRGGKRGQVFYWAHDGGPHAELIAASYADLFSSFVRHLEAGRYVQAVRRRKAFLDWVE